MTHDYEQEYSRIEAVFGTEAEPILLQFMDHLDPRATVLDIGAGQGRNSFPVLESGRQVHALEPSPAAGESLRRKAAERDLEIGIFPEGFQDFQPPREYEGIMVFGLIPDLTREEVGQLMGKIDRWLLPGGLLWISGFTTEDPAYPRHREQWMEIGLHSYRSPEGIVRTVLEPGEILQLLPQFTVLHHQEGLGPEHRHGEGPPERHGRFEAVLRR